MAKTKSPSKTKKESAAMDRRAIRTDRRNTSDRRKADVSVAEERRASSSPPRRKVNRRRQIDPTTCERDYSSEELEFMRAMDDYKRANGRMFPTCSEILEVVRALGYVRTLMDQPSEPSSSSKGSSVPNS